METRKATGFDDWLGRGNLKEKKELGMTTRFLLQVSGQNGFTIHRGKQYKSGKWCLGKWDVSSFFDMLNLKCLQDV